VRWGDRGRGEVQFACEVSKWMKSASVVEATASAEASATSRDAVECIGKCARKG
jgi:hypothetical protein